MSRFVGIDLGTTYSAVAYIDEFGKPILTIYVRKVERKDGVLVNTIVETVPDVSQFWKYDPKQFLASPTYSRDYPTSKNLE